MCIHAYRHDARGGGQVHCRVSFDRNISENFSISSSILKTLFLLWSSNNVKRFELWSECCLISYYREKRRLWGRNCQSTFSLWRSILRGRLHLVTSEVRSTHLPTIFKLCEKWLCHQGTSGRGPLPIATSKMAPHKRAHRRKILNTNCTPSPCHICSIEKSDEK